MRIGVFSGNINGGCWVRPSSWPVLRQQEAEGAAVGPMSHSNPLKPRPETFLSVGKMIVTKDTVRAMEAE
jgi:hypothetical protein